MISAIKARNVGYIPTFTRDLARFVYENRPAFFDEPFNRHIDAYRRRWRSWSTQTAGQDEGQQEAQAIKTALQQGSRNLKTLSCGCDDRARHRQRDEPGRGRATSAPSWR